MPKIFQILENNEWDQIQIPDGQELAVGSSVYYGSRKVLIDGVESEVAELVYGGTYNIEGGKTIGVVDGRITEINDMPPPSASMREKAAARMAEINAKNNTGK